MGKTLALIFCFWSLFWFLTEGGGLTCQELPYNTFWNVVLKRNNSDYREITNCAKYSSTYFTTIALKCWQDKMSNIVLHINLTIHFSSTKHRCCWSLSPKVSCYCGIGSVSFQFAEFSFLWPLTSNLYYRWANTTLEMPKEKKKREVTVTNTTRNKMQSCTRKGKNPATTTDSTETETPNEVMLSIEFLRLVYLIVFIRCIA